MIATTVVLLVAALSAILALWSIYNGLVMAPWRERTLAGKLELFPFSATLIFVATILVVVAALALVFAFLCWLLMVCFSIPEKARRRKAALGVSAAHKSA